MITATPVMVKEVAAGASVNRHPVCASSCKLTLKTWMSLDGVKVTLEIMQDVKSKAAAEAAVELVVNVMVLLLTTAPSP